MISTLEHHSPFVLFLPLTFTTVKFPSLFSRPKALHTLHLVAGNDWLDMKIICHETKGSFCRMNCAEGCETWSTQNHNHTIHDYGKCIAVEWFEAAGTLDCHIGEDELIHGMGVAVFFDGDCWIWEGI